jgi:hypothetical protein
MVPTNETVDRLNRRAQALRLRDGDLDQGGRSVRVGETTLCVGDEVATRRNNRQLETDQGKMVRNRARWTITQIHPDRTITVNGTSGTVRLPAPYVRDHVELAYASTGHAAQGRTVQHALVVVDKPTDLRNLYVPLTRGTESNHAYLAVTGEQAARDVFAQCLSTDWIDRPAHERQAELTGKQIHHPGLLDPDRLRTLLERGAELVDVLVTAREDTENVPAILAAAKRDHQAAVDELACLRTRLEEARAAVTEYDRPLKRRRHADNLAEAQRTIDTVPRWIEQATATARSLEHRVELLEATLAGARRTIAFDSPLRPELAQLNTIVDRDARARARHARLDPTSDLVHDLGPRPADVDAGIAWDRAAGERAQHTAAYPKEPQLTDLLADLDEHSLDVESNVSHDLSDDLGLDL